jgi:tetratricopeptide (TPR) repeat protein
MNKHLWIAVVAVSIVGLTGCAADKDKKPSYGYKQQRQDEPPDDFGTKKEPPISISTRIAAAKVSESRNDLAAAADQYDKVVAADPTYKFAWYRLGVLRSQLKQYDKSIVAWQQYKTLVGNDPIALANLGFAYDLAGRFDDAQATYLEGIQINPRHRACRVNYGLMLAKVGRVDDARAEFGAVLSPAEVCYNVGSVYEQQGKIDLARREYEKAVKLDPNMVDAKTRLEGLSATKSVAGAE